MENGEKQRFGSYTTRFHHSALECRLSIHFHTQKQAKRNTAFNVFIFPPLISPIHSLSLSLSLSLIFQSFQSVDEKLYTQKLKFCLNTKREKTWSIVVQTSYSWSPFFVRCLESVTAALNACACRAGMQLVHRLLLLPPQQHLPFLPRWNSAHTHTDHDDNVIVVGDMKRGSTEAHIPMQQVMLR